MADSMFQPKPRPKEYKVTGTKVEYDTLSDGFISGKALRRKNRMAAINRVRLVEPALEPKPAMSTADRAVIDKHYRDNYEILIKRIRSSCGSQEAAEDAVQEAYSRACKYIHNDVDDFNNWLWGILKKTVRAVQRDAIVKGVTTISMEKLEEEEKEGWLQQAFPAAQEKKYELKEIKKTIDCYKDLPASILRMALFGGYIYKDIASAVGTSEENVKVIVHRFRKQLAAR